jgi:filamentous hemagglutinin family protein
MSSYHRHAWWSRCVAVLCGSGYILCGIWLAVSLAQVPTHITPDPSVGTTVTPHGRVHTIAGGTIRGTNLFHSFDRFEVGTGDTASFIGPSSIENILSRVTGGQQSIIDGLLQSTIPGANLFLLNPAGVLFGPNASLDVRGSLHVSTADYLRFANGAEFHTDLGQPSTLTVAPPAAFGFLRAHPAAIASRDSTLQVPEGKTLALVGGKIEVGGSFLVAPGGQVHIVSAAAGEVMPPASNQTPERPVDTLGRLGQVTLADFTLVDVSGRRGGTVVIRGGRLLVDHASILAVTLGDVDGAAIGIDIEVAGEINHTGGTIATESHGGAGNAGDIRLAAGSLHVDGTDGASISSSTFGDGRSGNIVVQVGTLTLTNGALIGSSTFGTGQGGTVTITATDAIALSGFDNFTGFPSTIGTSTVAGSGAAGHVTLSAPTLTLEGGLIEAVSIAAGGPAGTITVEVTTLRLTGGARIDAHTDGAGQGGNVTVTATNGITISGQDSAGHASGLFSTTSGAGHAGRVTVLTPALELQGGMLQTVTTGAGNAGTITVDAGQVTLTGGAHIDGSTQSTGHGGTVTVTARDSLFLGSGSMLLNNALGNGAAGRVTISTPTLTLENGRIQSATVGGGAAGTIMVEAGQVSLTGGSQIDSSTQSTGQGGAITVTATEGITIHGADSAGNASGLFSETFSRGNGGNLTIFTPALTMAGGIVRAATFGAGKAGDIVVEVGRLTVSEGAAIDSSTSAAGQAGSVMVTATEALRISGRHRATGDPTRLGSIAGLGSSGKAGHVMLFTPHLTMEEGVISTSTFGEGRAGTIAVEAGRVTLTGGTQVSSSTRGSGRGGNVRVTTEALRISGRNRDGVPSRISSIAGGSEDAGRIVISTPTLTMAGGVIRALAEGTGGDAGAIVVDAGRIRLTHGAAIDSSTLRTGQGGTIRITARDALTMTGADGAGNASGLFSETFGSGDAGRIVISAPTLTMAGGLIQALTLGEGNAGAIQMQVEGVTVTDGARISSSSGARDLRPGELIGGSGQAGNVRIRAEDVIAISGQGSGLFTTAEGSGQGGDILLHGRRIQLSEGATISAQSAGTGHAGTIRLTATDTFLSANSAVTTAAERAGGGNIALASPLVRLTDSALTAEAQGMEQQGSDGGNVTIRAGFVIFDGSQVQANAFGGNGGMITIAAADAFLADPATCADQACLDASSRLGVAGTVEVSTPTADLSEVVTPLPQTFTQAAVLLPQRCAERLRGQPVSTFALAGRDSVPTQPGNVLPSPLVVEGSERTQRGPDKGREPGMPVIPYGNLGVDAHGRPRVQGWPVHGLASLAWDAACTQGYRGQEVSRTQRR